MGVYRRHAIVVVGNKAHEARIQLVHEKASAIFPWVSPLSPPQTNGEISFFIPPDGSAMGWPESAEATARRNQLIAFLQQGPLVDDWVEVCFGEDMPRSPVLRAKGYYPDDDEKAWQ
ncbi:hypothetical protein [Nevskia ramosa]|uniref:hypothetical protein n=1 Tax=Nevskia ramosa TaxID=64002 RepID=UPI0023577490|nr:hypothetical protein [Nevskia ramosa]